MEAADTQMRLNIAPLAANTSLRTLAYDAIKKAITEMDMYGQDGDIRLDERQLSTDLGVSRTPIREALTVLERRASYARCRGAASSWCASPRPRSST